MWRFPISIASAWSVLALLLAGCAADDDASPACRDDQCPIGESCGATGCEPVQPPPVTGDLGRHTATALRSDGRLVVSTYDATNRDLVVSVEHADGRTDVHVVDGWFLDDRSVVETDAGEWSDVAVDDSDRAHLVWFHASDGQLRYGRPSGDGLWTVETVDGKGPDVRGTHASVALGKAGEDPAAEPIVHVAYRDESARRLRYARRGVDGTWTTQAVDGCAGEQGCPTADEDYGAYASVAIIGGRPRVAFYDALRGDLKMATQGEDGVWATTTLDGRDVMTGRDTGDVGRFASLALTPNRIPGVAYYDATRGALRLVVAGSEPIVVDDGVVVDPISGASKTGAVGTHAALRFDPLGRAVILYLDGGAPAMKQALVSADTVIHVETLGALSAGVFPSFDLLGDDQIRGAYGAWVVDGSGALSTRLDRFLLPVYAQ